MFQHTAARRRLVNAGRLSDDHKAGFNTQPPEGGWGQSSRQYLFLRCFNTQPPEGGWLAISTFTVSNPLFQHTAARRRLATILLVSRKDSYVSTHSRPKAAGYTRADIDRLKEVSTHSRPKAAGLQVVKELIHYVVFQHTAARRRLGRCADNSSCVVLFQHTAARRRLDCMMLMTFG